MLLTFHIIIYFLNCILFVTPGLYACLHTDAQPKSTYVAIPTLCMPLQIKFLTVRGCTAVFPESRHFQAKIHKTVNQISLFPPVLPLFASMSCNIASTFSPPANLLPFYATNCLPFLFPHFVAAFQPPSLF